MSPSDLLVPQSAPTTQDFDPHKASKAQLIREYVKLQAVCAGLEVVTEDYKHQVDHRERILSNKLDRANFQLENLLQQVAQIEQQGQLV